MAVMPGVEFRPSPGGGPLMKRFDVICVHTIVGLAPAPAAHFSTTGDGHIFQHRDTRFQSAANANGNHRVIAIENADHGAEFEPWNTKDGHAVPAFTKAQCESIARIIAWVHDTHGIPIVPCPDSRPGSRGVGYHRQGIDGHFGDFAFGGRVSGGEVWTEHFGKVCPGDRRIRQLIDVIIPGARALTGQQEEDIVASLAELQAVVAAEIKKVWPGNVPGTPLPGRGGAIDMKDDQYGWTLHAAGFAASALAELKTQHTAIANLTAAVNSLVSALTNDNKVTGDELRAVIREELAGIGGLPKPERTG